MQNTFMAAVASVAAAAVKYAIAKTIHPLRTALISAMGGIAALLLVNLTAKATGCYIAINYLTVAAATVLSLPGVIGMLLLNIIFI